MFQSSIGFIPDLLIPPYSLKKAQVIESPFVAFKHLAKNFQGLDSDGESLTPWLIISTKLMFSRQSIFAMNPCCLYLDQNLIFEAARMAHKLRYHKSSSITESHLRAFWTIYHLEKIAAFSDDNSSVRHNLPIAYFRYEMFLFKFLTKFF